MTTLFISFVIISLAVLGMSVGLLRGRQIRGSCGGLNNQACACTAPCERKRRAGASKLSR